MRSLTLPELKGLFGEAGLPEPKASFYELRDEVRNLLARSFPEPGDDAKIIGDRRLMESSGKKVWRALAEIADPRDAR